MSSLATQTGLKNPVSTMGSNAGGGTAGIEILGFPQLLYTRSGEPDALFVPLLDACREAHEILERLIHHGEPKANAISLAGMNLASVLLKTSLFSLVARGQSHEHFYTIDLGEDLLRVSTRLYATVSRRASLFKVDIHGKISGGAFAVQNAGQNAVVVQADEQKLRQPNYFSNELARECLRAQIEQQRFGQMEESLGAQEGTELRLIVEVAGKKIPALLRPKPGAGWHIIDGRSQEWVGTLPAEVENHLKRVTAYLEELFAHS